MMRHEVFYITVYIFVINDTFLSYNTKMNYITDYLGS